MDKRKDFISITIIRSIVYGLFLIWFIVSLSTLNRGVFISEFNGLLSMSGANYTLPKVFLYILIISTIIMFVANITLSVKAIKAQKYENNNVIFMYGEAIVIALTFIVTIYLMTIFPLAYDSDNNHAFSISIVSLILSLTFLLVAIYNRFFKDEKTVMTVEIAAEGAMMAALAVVLSIASDLIPGLRLPQGGSFSLSMLPLFIFALRRGAIPGLIVGFLYGLINFIVDGMWFHWGSIFFDYLLPFALLAGFAGLFNKKAQEGQKHALIFAVLGGGFIRYIFHGFSGVIFFAEWMPSEFNNVWFYSFIAYNLPYMAVSTVGVLIVALLLQNRFITKDSRIQ